MISVFTPTHNLCWLPDAYAGLAAQTDPNWEWILVANGQARGHLRGFNDTRVRVVNAPPELDGKIGPLKKFACGQARGEAVLELDHDDILLPGAIAEAHRAFTDPGADFVYSNSVNHDYRVDYPMTWSGVHGWTHRPFPWQGRFMLESVSGAPAPANFSRIWYAPNHFRAWRKTFYDRIGGHNATLTAGDDHELVCRSYIAGGCRHVDQPLYIYRVTGENSWLKHQEEIQRVQWQNHDRFIEAMVARWCALEGGLRRVALGETQPADGYEALALDQVQGPWPFADSTLGAIRATDVFQFLADPIRVMNEVYRVLAHGGWAFITVPASPGLGACDNPANRSYWNARSFRYFTEKAMQARCPGLRCRFQKVKCDTVKTAEGVDYVVAHLVAVKEETPRFYGELLI